jgi:hypothetical protein
VARVARGPDLVVLVSLSLWNGILGLPVVLNLAFVVIVRILVTGWHLRSHCMLVFVMTATMCVTMFSMFMIVLVALMFMFLMTAPLLLMSVPMPMPVSVSMSISMTMIE